MASRDSDDACSAGHGAEDDVLVGHHGHLSSLSVPGSDARTTDAAELTILPIAAPSPLRYDHASDLRAVGGDKPAAVHCGS